MDRLDFSHRECEGWPHHGSSCFTFNFVVRYSQYSIYIYICPLNNVVEPRWRRIQVRKKSYQIILLRDRRKNNRCVNDLSRVVTPLRPDRESDHDCKSEALRRWLQLQFDSHSTAVPKRYDSSTSRPICSGLLHCGLNKQAVRVATRYTSAPCKLTISSYLFTRWHLFWHVGNLRYQQVDLWPFYPESGVRVTCDVGYLCANFSLPKPLCSRVRYDVCDRQTSDKSIAWCLRPMGAEA